MNPLISIIVPVYNVEQYLDECISSIVKQSYENLEIVLVDDGSSDKSPYICDEWSDKDSRVKVIHKQNGGLSSARNTGLSIITGEYVGFVDSDDYISEDMYESLIGKIIESNCEISSCGIEMFWEESGKVKIQTRKGDLVLDNHDAIKSLLEETWIKQPVYNKLYKRKVVENIYFEPGKIHEDVFWSYKVISRCRSISIFEKTCYHYRQRANSILNTQFSIKRLDALDEMEKVYESLKCQYPDLVDIQARKIYFECIYIYQKAQREAKNQELIEINSRIEYYKGRVKVSAHEFRMLPLKKKIWYLISIINFEKTCRLRNYLGIGL